MSRVRLHLLAVAVAVVACAALIPVGIAAQAPGGQAADIAERVLLTAGRSTVVLTEFDITRIAVTNPAVADAVVVRPREILVDGKGAGTVSLIVWGATERKHFDVVVDPGVTTLQQNFQQLFAGESINVAVTDEAVILSGPVSSNDVMLRAGELAKAAMPKLSVINMLELPSGSPSKQVMLQVRFAEVNRNALQQSGLTLFSTRNEVTGRTSTQQYPGPNFSTDGDIESLEFSDFLNIFLFSRTQGIGGVLKALQGRGFLQSLAEPNLIAYNGQEASFLAGGEIPIPIVTGLGQLSILFKEFGIRLSFTPTIAGDVIRLKLRPEVSTLDFTNGIVLSGFRIPALNTRRAETDVELRDGQSFAIAGLLNNLTQTDRQAIPLLSRLPIIGNLFKSRGVRAEQTELMVLVTPRLVRALDPDEVPSLPVRPGAFINPSDSENEGVPEVEPETPGLEDAPPPATRKPATPPGVVPPRRPGGL
ncbi:MAG: pilus assembly protein N-terminal domain-containing protein [Acidobacteria bacterium]|nr:pilus assembly protein N-terminal domain-containing protein [Acidobacteriota bacterium]